MKSLAYEESIQMQNSVEGAAFIAYNWAVISTNAYDPLPHLHSFVNSKYEGEELISQYKKEGYSVNFEIVQLATFAKLK
jgi:hypothetical protein